MEFRVNALCASPHVSHWSYPLPGRAGDGPPESEHPVLGADEVHQLCHQRDSQDQPSSSGRLQSGSQDLRD